ncbi:hypothetical protein [Nannocystis bainbridge]|uniref:Lipoprotein n=1 Tax=Nannocystis bainbridge TaxID=2995303 RepID=A0ABT5EBB1_9BACT|nr:hypothetical protein [Nannocystis bainbridge]MDC0723160.1 hypothetical protein [Nannocystis bainbridge]
MMIGAVGAFGLVGCTENEVDEADLGDDVEFKKDGDPKAFPGESFSADKLPFVEPLETAEVFVQKLPKATEAGDNVAVHIKLDKPHNKDLQDSLVRVVGDPKNPMMLVRSDALVELGVLKESPGKEFFTAFATLSAEELEQRAKTEQNLAKFGETTKDRIVFEGRNPIAVTTGIKFDISVFDTGVPVALGPCPLAPISTPARWEEALLITDLSVVRDKNRTNDVCHPGADNPNGVWTFKHLMEEMAIGSGLSTNDFVVKWLSTWLTNQVVNSDTLPARTQMFQQVIRPWANASGVTSSLVGGNLTLGGPLNLDKAPFRLSAIVNRIDLGETSSGGMYGGGGMPLTAGEMRFVFGVQNLNSCAQLPFSVIFEYGVPREDCAAIKDWANQWIRLSDPLLPRFSSSWRAHLESITENVVLNGAAPAKGNQNAINQIRTNENALNFQWELREFTLSTEDALTNVDTPTDGPLQPHTVALTPNDSFYNASGDVDIDDWTLFTPMPPSGAPGAVLSEVSFGAAFTTGASGNTIVSDCSPSYSMPLVASGLPLRGGNAFVSPVDHWQIAAADPSDPREVCARQQFSINSCSGCHKEDSATPFFHVDPTSAPASLSNFLTGGGAGNVWAVPDQQWGPGVAWMEFADLDRRHNRLYEIACNSCGRRFVFPHLIDVIMEVNGMVPVDTGVAEDSPIKVGPVTKLDTVKHLLNAAAKVDKDAVAQDVELSRFTGTSQVFVH